MRFVALGFIDQVKWANMLDGGEPALVREIKAYDERLIADGNFVGGETLVPSSRSITVHGGRKPSTTDGPFAETKEQLGGIIFLEARDQKHAAELMSQHPSVRGGASWEIRPVTHLYQS